ncbi:MAG TPA: hypothetical protein ENK44_13930 [Caldithrix abyssi]|uniref:Uncharacterized protein n=1 Tax=Caldithrix abyssi TaxID=187145 RepID=A0A7V4U2D5_CALAY|nr:hypothetical protein [Caldithrix abyssi]
MLFEVVEVKTKAGYRSVERPAAFFYQEQRYEIDEVIDRWYEGGLDPRRPIMTYFKVHTTDDQIFLLRYNQKRDVWALMISS